MLKKLLDRITYTPETVHLYSAGLSDVGQRRKHNEDNYLIDEKLGLFIVADGMGGHQEGEVASKLAVEIIYQHLKKLEFPKPPNNAEDTEQLIFSHLQDAIEEANNQTHCYNIAQGNIEGNGMGTTLTGFLIGMANSPGNNRIYSFNVGDSRTYSFRNETLLQLTTDHSHYQLWLDTGQEGDPPTHNIIYKAIGPWRRIVAQQQSFTIHDNEMFLLCSDGLSDMLTNEQMQTILLENTGKPLAEITRILVEAANDAGGKDNITVVLVKP